MVKRGAEKARLKKIRHWRMTRPNVADIFSRRQTSTRELATQGTVTTVHLHLCIWQMLFEGILFFYSVQVLLFFCLSVSIQCK